MKAKSQFRMAPIASIKYVWLNDNIFSWKNTRKRLQHEIILQSKTIKFNFDVVVLPNLRNTSGGEMVFGPSRQAPLDRCVASHGVGPGFYGYHGVPAGRLRTPQCSHPQRERALLHQTRPFRAIQVLSRHGLHQNQLRMSVACPALMHIHICNAMLFWRQT